MNHRKYVILIFSAAFLIKIFLMVFALYYTGFDKEIFYKPDTGSYLNPTKELLKTGSFAQNGVPDTVRTPGFSLILIPGILSGQVETVTVLINIILSALTAALVYKIAFFLFGHEKKAFFCGLLYAFEPLALIYSNKLLTEPFFGFLFALFIYYSLKFFKYQKFFYLASSAFLLSASIYVRPAAYYLPVLTAFLIVFFYFKKDFYKGILNAFIFLIICAALIGAWQLRNKTLTGYGGFTTIGAESLYFYNAAAVIAKNENRSIYEVKRELIENVNSMNLTLTQKDAYMKKESRRIIKNNSGLFLKNHIKGIARIIYDPAGTEYIRLLKLYPEDAGMLGLLYEKGLLKAALQVMRTRPLFFFVNVFFGVIWLFYFGLFITGVLRKEIIKRKELIFLIVIAAYFPAVTAGPVAYSRMRYPSMIILCLFAGPALFKLTDFLKNRKKSLS